MKKRKLLMGALFCSIGIMGSTTVYAKNLTIDGISFEIPDEWQEVQNETKEAGSAYIKYQFAGGEPYYYTVPYADDTTIVDDTMFDAGREELRKTDGYTEISTSVDDVNGIRKHFTSFYVGDDMGMLVSFDTGKSILNAVYITPEGTSYDDSSQWAMSVDNPKKADDTVNDKTYSAAPEDTIKSTIKSRISDQYRDTDITEITINEDAGTDTLDDYIALVYLKWNVQNSKDTSEKMLSMYSNDLAAYLAEKCPNVSEVSVFWEVPYLTTNTSKWSFERNGENMYLTDNVLGW